VLVNVTIRGNHATVCAGGVRATHSGRMSNVTLVNNVCDVGAAGGFFSFDANAWQVENSVIAQNSCGTPPVVQDCDGAFISGGYNLVGIGTDCVGFDETGDVVGPGPGSLDPILESLDNNGGWTPTHLPGPGSPLIQGGDPSGCFVDRDGSGAGAETLLLQDQRGAARPANGRCERGAVELGPIFFDGFESGSTVRWADTVP
jgi:hypothetical protein